MKTLKFNFLIGTLAIGALTGCHQAPQSKEAQIAAILQDAPVQMNDPQHEDEKLMRDVAAKRKKSHAYNGGGSKAWTHTY